MNISGDVSVLRSSLSVAGLYKLVFLGLFVHALYVNPSPTYGNVYVRHIKSHMFNHSH